LIKRGLVLDVLDRNLQEFCVPAEVIRTINIALLCVQHNPEKRPSMSQVVTLLAGNMGVEGFLSDSKNMQSNFDELLVTISSDVDYPALQKLAEDSTMYPPLSLDSEPSSSNLGTRVLSSNSSLRTDPVIEMGAIYGR
jgi:hypothetical protein